MPHRHFIPLFFFFNDTATTEIYTLSLHDALPISVPPGRVEEGTGRHRVRNADGVDPVRCHLRKVAFNEDRKSTRLNSSHGYISYAVFCLKKKIINEQNRDYYRAHNMSYTYPRKPT